MRELLNAKMNVDVLLGIDTEETKRHSKRLENEQNLWCFQFPLVVRRAAQLSPLGGNLGYGASPHQALHNGPSALARAIMPCLRNVSGLIDTPRYQPKHSIAKEPRRHWNIKEYVGIIIDTIRGGHGVNLYWSLCPPSKVMILSVKVIWGRIAFLISRRR